MHTYIRTNGCTDIKLYSILMNLNDTVKMYQMITLKK